jgi:autotransporter-associated beta strand protein
VIYSTEQELGSPTRLIINTRGQVVGPREGASIECNGETCEKFTKADFSAPFVLNRIDPTRIAIGGGTDVYVTTDPLTAIRRTKTVDLNLIDVGTTAGPSVISYGTADNPNALAVGAGPVLAQPETDPNASPASSKTSAQGEVWFTPTSTAGSLTQLTKYAGGTPTGIVFDTRNQSRIFVADGSNLFYTRNANAGTTATFTQYSPATPSQTSPFPTGFTRPTSVEFISNNGVNALFVGGLNTPLSCTSAPNGCMISRGQSPITVADSSSDGDLSGWRAFGRGLPNALVNQMAYNAAVDVLSASLLGRGAWLLYDVTSNFPQAIVLQFGLANNNSNPDPALLTDGTVGSRPLIKYGTGTLTIRGDATYSGSTTINGGHPAS